MTIVVTNETGGTAQPVGATYVSPERQMPAGESATLVEAGVDATFVADFLSACVAHERCGVQLYRSVAGRTGHVELRAQYEEFGDETREHVDKLERLITAADGDPQYVSASARAAEKAGAGLLESTYMLDGSVDPTTTELAMLEAVMLAETKDRSNWELLARLAEAMADSELRRRMETVTSEVLAQEEKHYTWARDTRGGMLLALAGIPTAFDGLSSRGTSAGGDERTRDELYTSAQELNIPGRSQMTKAELQAAIVEQEGQQS